MTPADPSLLAQLRQLPSPVVYGARPQTFFCQWCKAEWSGQGSRADNPHPANDCLWYVAHAPAAILEAQPRETAQTQPLGFGEWLAAECNAYIKDFGPEMWRASAYKTIFDKFNALAAPTPDPLSPVSAEADIIADQEARLDAAYLCGDRLPIANAATQEVTYAVCVLDKGHGGADHVSAAGIHRWPRRQPPVETSTPTNDPQKMREEAARIAALPDWTKPRPTKENMPRPADTPTGLAPLRTMTQREFDWNSPPQTYCDNDRVIAYRREIDAQRQASASVRREAMQDAYEAVVANIHDYGGHPAITAVRLLLEKCDQPRVSPRPPSGGKP